MSYRFFEGGTAQLLCGAGMELGAVARVEALCVLIAHGGKQWCARWKAMVKSTGCVDCARRKAPVVSIVHGG